MVTSIDTWNTLKVGCCYNVTPIKCIRMFLFLMKLTPDLVLKTPYQPSPSHSKRIGHRPIGSRVFFTLDGCKILICDSSLTPSFPTNAFQFNPTRAGAKQGLSNSHLEKSDVLKMKKIPSYTNDCLCFHPPHGRCHETPPKRRHVEM